MDLSKKSRRAARAQFTRIANLLEASDAFTPEGEAQYILLEELATKLAVLDSEIEKFLLDKDGDDAELEKELDDVATYRLRWITIQNARKKPQVGVHKQEERNYKLPRLEQIKFDGNLKSWLPFWAQFEKIHLDQMMNENDKLQYLRQSMTPGTEVSRFIDSYPATSKSYQQAIADLKERYARNDLLIQVYVRELLTMILHKDSNSNSLTCLYDQISTQLRALEILGVTQEGYASFILPMVESAIPLETLKAWERARPAAMKNELQSLLEFLKKEVESEQRIQLATTAFSQEQKDTPMKESTAAALVAATTTTAGASETKKQVTCLWCDKNHSSIECYKLAKMSLEQRRDHIKKKKACLNCLKIGHNAKVCKSFVQCFICKKRHSVTLCPGTSENTEIKGSETTDSSTASNFAAQGSTVTLLQTTMVRIVNGDKQMMVRALVDNGSQRSYLRKDIAQKLGLKEAGRETLTHCLFSGVQVRSKVHNIYNISVQSSDKSFSMELAALDQPVICNNLPKYNNSDTNLTRLLGKNNIVLADNDCTEISLLIGADYSGYIMTDTMVVLKDGLIAIKTKLGWVLQGKVENSNNNSTNTLFCASDISGFWSLELLGIRDPVENKSKIQAETEAVMAFEESININVEGRYEVSLPLKVGHEELLNNRDVAEKRLRATTKRLMSTGKFYEYHNIICSWETEGIVERVPEAQSVKQGMHYLPHRGVSKDSSMTTKLRPVYDASACDKNSRSLNSYLNKGVNFLDKIPHLLTGFRKGVIGISADIAKAFLQVSVKPSDRDYLRFLWWQDESRADIVEYRHCRVVFGLTSSPFLLSATIAHHLRQVTGKEKETAGILAKSFYVDNCITSMDSKEEVNKFIAEAKDIMRLAKFDLRQWATSPNGINETSSKVVSILGLMWNTETDELSCNLGNLPHYAELGKITKKDLMSLIQRIFDPIGFTCPVTLIPRLIMQETWRRGLTWDEKLPDDLEAEFRKWYEHVSFLGECKIPRRLTNYRMAESTLSLHLFCDASKLAYGACVLLRSEKEGNVSVRMLSAKSRVAPPGKASIPRLELTATLIGSRLLAEVKKSLGIKEIEEYCWTDSCVAYYWITKNLPWNVYVHNRVKEIRENTKISCWHHCSGTLNWADVASRGCNAEQLVSLRWWEGPAWLKLPREEWPKSSLHIDGKEACKELQKTKTACNADICVKEGLPQPLAQAPLALPPPTAAPAPPAAHASAPRTIVIQRPDARHGFGFTLRHLVVYPPDSLQDLYEDARHLAVGAVGAPMDTIFVRSVRPGGPAAAAGLRAGDRVLAVNGEPVACGRSRAPYARVVQLAQREPRILRLTVVPRDHDLLQRYFSEAAYNPETNQRPLDMPAPVTEHESRLFDAYRRPRAALPAPQAPARHRDDPEYASVASLAPSRYDVSRFTGTPHYLLQDGRRESDTSLPSSATESKDSLGSFDSNSTLTGRELDDSIILSRIRKSLEQKEAFLRRPSQPTGWVTPDAPPPIKQKEFYARPQKMQQPAWPPPAVSPPPTASPPPQPAPQNLDRKDECSASVDSGTFSGYGEVNGSQNDKSRQKQDKSQFVSTLSKIQETGPSLMGTNIGPVNGAADGKDANEENKYPVAELQLVTARTRQLEEARGGGSRRTEAARSELARLSTTRLQPSVALRRKEFEGRAARREARSLDVQPQELDVESQLGGSLSGNQLMITGSKHLHCPPPDGYAPETEKVQMRTRSNSTGSDGLPIRRHHATDGSHAKRRMGLNKEQMEAMNRVSLGVANGEQAGARRPTQLSLAPRAEPPAQPAQPSPTPSTPADSGFADDLVTRRQKKDAQLGEEERAMRRVSYLKATWGDRLHLDSDVEPDNDPQGLRGLRKWRPPRFTDDITPLLRIFDPQAALPVRSTKKGEEEIAENAVETAEGDVQGNVQIKMVVSNGKRASDRSWKQVWAVLHGTKLYLYRHHPSQSPGAVTGSGTDAQPGSRDALDVRYSLAALADDYTKRKHVVRVTTAAGAELLLQAEGAADAQRWLAALRRHSAEPPPVEPASAPALPPADCPSPLPPQRSKKIGRNRSPTGPPTPTLPSSPKNKTWKGRMAKQLRRMHGGTAPAAAPAPGWLGAALERCPHDPEHPLVPKAVTLPAHAVEAYGLRTVGVYRVPGNAAGVAALAAALDRGEPPPTNDARWADVHVASSLLKAYLRRLPDPLLTADLYPAFIAADRSPERARELQRLVRALPDAHYETLKYLIQHLRRVVAHSAYNKMEARNLAIVFGPTLVRAASDDMLAMVNDMSSQCRIIESFLTHYEWYFEEEEGDPPMDPPPSAEELSPAPAPSRDLLIHNVKKIEGKDVSTRDIVSSIISAANRKIQRKPRSKPDKKEDKRSPCGSPAGGSPAGGSPPPSPLCEPPHHLTTALADYDGLDHCDARDANKNELETLPALGRGRQELSRHTHALTNFSIDGTGDLVSSLTSTFDQKLRTLNNSSPLDDGSIPYADECQDETEEGKSSASSPSEGAGSERDERVSPAARAHELKAAWLARDHRHSSSSSADDERAWPRRAARDDPDDSEKENCGGPRRREPEPAAPAPAQRDHKRNSAALEPAPPAASPDDDGAKLKRSESLPREPERAARVLRSESLNCRNERPQRSDSLGKAERRPERAERTDWPAVRRRDAAAWRSTKLKRKNGMPERGIKRRHTVGGTKDFDKDGWSARHTRTSSPDLSSDLSADLASVWPTPLVPPPRPPLESHV